MSSFNLKWFKPSNLCTRRFPEIQWSMTLKKYFGNSTQISLPNDVFVLANVFFLIFEKCKLPQVSNQCMEVINSTRHVISYTSKTTVKHYITDHCSVCVVTYWKLEIFCGNPTWTVLNIDKKPHTLGVHKKLIGTTC